MSRWRSLISILAVAGGMLAGALLAAVPAGAQVFVNVPPPPPRVERIPPPPGPPSAYVWDRGHWHWNGNRYVWSPGHYVRAVRPGARWVPGHWARRDGRWFWIDGHWA
jgi:hypothetical protein